MGHAPIIGCVPGEVVIEGYIEGIIDVVKEPLNSDFVDACPAKEPKEQTPEPTRGTVAKDSASVDMVIMPDERCLPYLPVGVHGYAPICLACI